MAIPYNFTGKCVFWSLHEYGDCSQTIVSAYPTEWLAWRAAAWSAQGLAMVLMLYNLGARLRTQWSWIRGGPGGASAFTLRDMAMVLTFAACAVRCLWLIDPTATNGPVVSTPDAVLLRFPQILWFAAFAVIVLVWDSILRAARPDRSRTSCLRGVLLSSVVVLLAVSVVATVLSTLTTEAKERELWRIVGDGSFAVYAIGYMGFGLTYGLAVYRLLMTHLQHSSASLQPQLLFVMEQTLLTLGFSFADGAVLIATISVALGFDIAPFHDPVLYLGFMTIVHAVVEPVFAFILVYATWYRARRSRTRGRVLRESEVETPLNPQQAQRRVGSSSSLSRALMCVCASLDRCCRCGGQQTIVGKEPPASTRKGRRRRRRGEHGGRSRSRDHARGHGGGDGRNVRQASTQSQTRSKRAEQLSASTQRDTSTGSSDSGSEADDLYMPAPRRTADLRFAATGNGDANGVLSTARFGSGRHGGGGSASYGTGGGEQHVPASTPLGPGSAVREASGVLSEASTSSLLMARLAPETTSVTVGADDSVDADEFGYGDNVSAVVEARRH